MKNKSLIWRRFENANLFCKHDFSYLIALFSMGSTLSGEISQETANEILKKNKNRFARSTSL